MSALRRFANSAGSIAVATAVMNLCTYGFTIIAARLLDPQSYGAFFALMNLVMVTSVVQLGLQATAARRIVADPLHVATIERSVLRVTNRMALTMGLALMALAPILIWLLKLDSVAPALLLGVLTIPVTIMGGQLGVLQGEKRWAALASMYLTAGFPRLAGLGLLLWSPTEFWALAGSGLGFVAPMFLGWWLLRHKRTPEDQIAAHGGWAIVGETFRSSSALLAFFALANVDIVIARHALGPHDSGLYAAGLIVTKVMLFLPQFVVIVLFPALAASERRRQTLVRGTVALGVIGAGAGGAVALFSPAALIVVGGEKYAEVEGTLWLFALIGTLLSIGQLLVYAILARRGRRATYVVWLALAVVIALGLRADSVTGLAAVMIGTLTAMSAILLVAGTRPQR